MKTHQTRDLEDIMEATKRDPANPKVCGPAKTDFSRRSGIRASRQGRLWFKGPVFSGELDLSW